MLSVASHRSLMCATCVTACEHLQKGGGSESAGEEWTGRSARR